MIINSGLPLGCGIAWKVPGRSWSAPQDAEAGARTNLELDAGLLTHHVVLAVAEEGEVVGVQPAEQLAGQRCLIRMTTDELRDL